MMGTMATVEDEEIDDVSLLGAGAKRRKKKSTSPRGRFGTKRTGSG